MKKFKKQNEAMVKVAAGALEYCIEVVFEERKGGGLNPDSFSLSIVSQISHNQSEKHSNQPSYRDRIKQGIEERRAVTCIHRKIVFN